MKYIIPIILIGVLLFYFSLPASKDIDDSSKISILLNNLIKSGERKDLNIVMEYFSPDYKDASGRTSPVIKNIIKDAFDRFDVLEGSYSDLIVSIRENGNGENETTANLNIWIKGVRKSTPYALIGTEDNPQNINIVLESFMLGGWKILDVEGLD
ncbi:MAG: hypothetical protein O6499_02355 [Candidatus Dadabacteria bacterium]|nr:hypothetical protein [Candidatus Dadabacteria bacterium]